MNQLCSNFRCRYAESYSNCVLTAMKSAPQVNNGRLAMIAIAAFALKEQLFIQFCSMGTSIYTMCLNSSVLKRLKY